MSVARRLLHEARQAGVELRVVGGRLQAKRRARLRPDLLEALCRHKSEVAILLKSQQEPAPVPPCCHGCNALEIIPGVGAGCVRPLPGGPWREEWRRLPADLKRCGERQEAAPDRRTVRAKGTGCGRWRQRDIHGR